MLNDPPFGRENLHIIYEGAGIAIVVTQHIFQLSMLVAADSKRAVVQVHTGINGLDGGIDGIPFLITSNDIIAQLEWQHLLVVEHVLYDNNTAEFRFEV